MSEESDPAKRPNAKYNLSYPDSSYPGGNASEEEGLTFHYSRARRLESAPKEVRSLYEEKKPNRLSFFGVLVADKPRRTLFVIIILLCLAILALSQFGYFDTTYTLEGNKIEISGTIFEDTTIVILKKTANNAQAYTGAVEIAVSVAVEPGEINPVFAHRVYFTLENQEVYRFAVPFVTGELLMVLQTETNAIQLKFKPE